MNFSENEYVDASQQKKIQLKNEIKKFNVWGFLAKKQWKLIKNEENRQNSNRFIKFSEIWYVDAFQHKKVDFSIFGPFCWPKNSQNWY